MSSSLLLPRRKFLIGAASLLAAPAIVRAESLMPVKMLKIPHTSMLTLEEYIRRILLPMELAYQQAVADAILKGTPYICVPPPVSLHSVGVSISDLTVVPTPR